MMAPELVDLEGEETTPATPARSPAKTCPDYSDIHCLILSNFRKYILFQSVIHKRLYLATAWSLYPDSCFSDYYGRYLLYKKAHFEVAKPKVAIYVLTEVRHGPAGR